MPAPAPARRAARRAAPTAAVLALALAVFALPSPAAAPTPRAAPPAPAAPPKAAPATRPPFRILHVMSYHSPWRWTDGQLRGFQEALAGVPAEYEVVQLDTKRSGTPEARERAAAAARARIERWRPDLVYASDDDAQELVVRHHAGSALPFVFSGVNRDPAVYGFGRAPNVTGVVEHEHFVESVQLLRKLVPSVRRIAVVLDEDEMWAPVEARMRAAAATIPGLVLGPWDRPRTFAEFKRRMAEYPALGVDAVALLGIFGLRDEAGRKVPYQTVLRWTAEHGTLPDLSFWLDRVHFGTLCAVTVSEREQGLAAGRLARAILVDGKAPGSLPVKSTVKGVPAINLARARRLGITPSSGLLLSVEVIPGYDWERP